MIHLIMVLSAIMLPSCTTVDFHFLESHPNTSSSAASLRRAADDTADAAHPPSLKTQLSDPNNLILSSTILSATPKSDLNQTFLEEHSPLGLYVKHNALSKALRRRRIYQQDRQGEKKDDADVKGVQKPPQPPSLKAYSRLPRKSQLVERAILKKRKKKRRTFSKHFTNDHDATGRSLPNRIRQKSRGNGRLVTGDNFSRDHNANRVHKNYEQDDIDNSVNIMSKTDSNSDTSGVFINNRTTLNTQTNSDKVKRSINSEQTVQNASSKAIQNDNNTSLDEVDTEVNSSVRHTTRNITSEGGIDGGPSSVHPRTPAGNAGTNTTRRGKRRRRGRRRHRPNKDLSLWIDERQVKLFSGYMMEIYAIHNGGVLPYILDPNFEKHLPIIPFEVQSVNFTWQAGRKRYYYTFDRLYSHDPSLLQAPVVSLPTQGRVPRKPKVFTVNILCTGNASGIASFEIGLLIQTRRGKPMPGTPLRLKLRKECTLPSPDPECDEKCENGGVCDVGRSCQCPEGYMGQYCNTALCYPQCMNGGTCTTPGRCTCPPGYQGRHCEGGICRDKCENGGKCIQKDTCACPRGYYGNRCEFSKCVIPCINGGRCRNVNKCRCPHGFAGDHCEVVTGRSHGATAIARCTRKCRHGSCRGTTCQCKQGYTGRWCRRRGTKRKRVWL